MSAFRFDLLVLGAIIAGLAIAGVYLFMLAVPRNDDEQLHDALSEGGHPKTRLLRWLVQLRRGFSRRSGH